MKLRPKDKIFYGYISISGLLILLFGYDLDSLFYHIAFRALAAIVVYWLIRADAKYDSGGIHFWREWYPLPLFIFMYEELKWVKFMIIPFSLDPQVAQLERLVFGFQPALEFFKTFHWKWFAEYMYFSYFFYFWAIPVVAAVFWIKKQFDIFRKYVFTVALTFYVFFVIFFLFPSGGPRLYFPEVIGLKLDGYFFAFLLNKIYSVGETGTAAFPSSHVGVALVIVIYVNKYIKKARLPVTIVIASLFCATVYGRFHYAVDVIAGLVIGLIFYLIGPKLYNKLNKKHDKSK